MSLNVCCLDHQIARTPDARVRVAQQKHERQYTRVVSDIAPRTVLVGQKPQTLGLRKPSRSCAVTNEGHWTFCQGIRDQV